MADADVDPLEESMGSVSITKRKLEQAKEQDAQVEAEIVALDHQMVTKSITEKFVSNILSETLVNIASLSPRSALAAETEAVSETTTAADVVDNSDTVAAGETS